MHTEEVTCASELLDLTTSIVAAYLSNNTIAAADIPALITTVHASLGSVGEPVAVKPEPLVPAVPIRQSVKHDHIVCLEDGKHLKMLKRHLRTAYDMSPDQYRAKWNLPRDYPMVAPAYSEKRSQLALSYGLGKSNKIPGRQRRVA